MTGTALQFRPPIFPTLLMLVVTPLFVTLGFWQLDRAEQKRNIASALEMRRKLPALPLGKEIPEAAELEYRSVRASGRFLGDRTVLIENRKHQGKSGFHVITPLQLKGEAGIILVNRGWVPQQQGEPVFDTPEGEITLEGKVNLPEPPALQLSQAPGDSSTPPHWPFLTLDLYREWSGMEILPFMILQSGDDPGAFVRQWPQPQSNEGMHIGYAIQWFAFAGIALLIWLRLSLRKRSPETYV